MTGKIINLTERTLPGEVDQGIVDTIADLLTRAKAGEITAFAWAGYMPNDEVFHGWEGSGGTMFQLAAAVMMLQSRYALSMHADHSDD